MRADKHLRKKKRGRRRLFVFFTIVTLLFAGVAWFVYDQFLSGLNETAAESTIKKTEYEFNGQKDENGNTNVLVLGSDSRGEKQARTDTIMIAQYNEKSKKPKLLSIMRDSYVEIPGHGQNKINTAFAIGGPDLLRETIKHNFDIDIQHYAIVDFKGFESMIDTAFPKGVEVDVENKMSHKIGVTIEPGVQKLDGEHLLGYVRYRGDAESDFGRVRRQQEVMNLLMKDMLTIEGVAKLPKLAGVITPYINTNLDTSTGIFIAKDIISNKSDLKTMRVPVDGSFENARYNGSGAVLDLNIEENREAIKSFMNS
ncbi:MULTISPECIES: LCP family protein [Bacillaceae]|uniref:LCP family protein n=1 Tax=Bacillaceae TaxID=186817 RepID=UPI000C78B50A|nr:MULTISPECIES: LCP family protein [Bacillaceae]PLR69367.1 transcriptional regulator [Bacillus sp. UMB0893]